MTAALFDVVNPATEEVVARVPETSLEETDAAIERAAADLFEGSAIARAALGDDVVDHYVTMARVEQTAFDAAVTDWERVRGFERL